MKNPNVQNTACGMCCGLGWKAAEAWLSSEIWLLLPQLSSGLFSPVFVFMETKYVKTVWSQMFILNVVIALGDNIFCSSSF